MNGKYYLYQNMLSLIQLSICGETTLSTKRGLISQYAPHKIQKTSVKPILICFPIIFYSNTNYLLHVEYYQERHLSIL
jgi:hypothetical protein